MFSIENKRTIDQAQATDNNLRPEVVNHHHPAQVASTECHIKRPRMATSPVAMSTMASPSPSAQGTTTTSPLAFSTLATPSSSSSSPPSPSSLHQTPLPQHKPTTGTAQPSWSPYSSPPPPPLPSSVPAAAEEGTLQSQITSVASTPQQQPPVKRGLSLKLAGKK